MKLTRHHFLDPRVAIGASLVVAVGAVGYALYSLNHVPLGEYTKPVRGAIVQDVTTTGTVQAATSVDLSFQASGSVRYAGPNVGTHVSQGTVLATLNAADLAAQLDQAKAGLAAQEAKLAGLQSGARPEDIALSQTQVASASSSLLQARQGVVAIANDSYIKADDAIHSKVDQFIINPRTNAPALSFTVSNSQLAQAVLSDRVQMESMLQEWQRYNAAIPQDPSMVDAGAVTTANQMYLSRIAAYLDEVANVLSSAVPNTSITASMIQGYQANITLARSNISSDTSALNTAALSEKAAEGTLSSAQAQLTLKQAPSSATDIQAQQAVVASAQAAVELAQAQLGKTVIVAPFAGIVTVNNAKLGATATPGAPLISMNSDARFQMQAFVSDADVAKVAPLQEATVQLNAYPNVSFKAHVVSVDPAATIQNGVSAYKVTLQFDDDDPRVLAGLSGSADIFTKSQGDALSVPSSAIITHGNNTFVLKKTSSGDVLTPVVTGITNSSGMTQVLSGITEADEVRSFGNQ